MQTPPVDLRKRILARIDEHAQGKGRTMRRSRADLRGGDDTEMLDDDDDDDDDDELEVDNEDEGEGEGEGGAGASSALVSVWCGFFSTERRGAEEICSTR